MKILNLEVNRKHLLWGILIHAPWFKFAIEFSKQSPKKSVFDLYCFGKPQKSIMNTTDPLLMDRRQRHENTVRIMLERKGFSRREIELPLTDERMQKIGRMPWWRYVRFSNLIQENYPKLYDSSPIGAVDAGETIRMERRDEQA